MQQWRRLLVAVLGAVSLVGAGAIGVSAHEGRTLVEFDSMTPVTGAAVGAVNERGIKGGGLPWAIRSGSGAVSKNGEVKVTVRGLVIPVAPFNGTNPVAKFGATVSCLTEQGVVNVSTGLFPANSEGNSTINGRVALPKHCKDPVVFVVSPGGAWFSMSNPDKD
jgi:hypothetical protein